MEAQAPALSVPPLTDEQKAAELPFDAVAFTLALNEKTAARRAIMRTQGDAVQAVAVARWIVGCNDAKHEPWLSNMELLINEIDKERAENERLSRLLAEERAALAAQEVEKLELVKEVKEQGKELFKALSALAGMWNQYCPPPTEKCPYPGHMFMSAGEQAEEVLEQWGLMRSNETAIDCDFASEIDEAPAKVRALLNGKPAAPSCQRDCQKCDKPLSAEKLAAFGYEEPAGGAGVGLQGGEGGGRG